MTADAASEFETLLMCAMLDAAIEGKITQLQTSITPPGQGPKLIRLIVVPEEMDYVRPKTTGPFQRPG